jgi:flavodoxin
MKKLFAILLALMTITSCNANESDSPQSAPGESGAYFNGKKVLVAYFSWGGTTRRMAEAIQSTTGGDIFEIEPVVPYPSEYTPCTEVALEERDNDARPAIKNSVENWDEYDIVFIGCPVWWHTAPMIISTFAESYDFSGKTVVPFCTYAATFRDETLQKIVDLTPAAEHLEGLGTTGNTSGVAAWIERISAEWNASHPDSSVIAEIRSENIGGTTLFYDLNGLPVSNPEAQKGIFIARDSSGTRKIMR